MTSMQHEPIQVSSIVYLSRTTRPFGPDDVVELADRAAEANELHGVTGYLTYSEPHFTQYIEGPETELLAVWDRIQNDARHKIVQSVGLGLAERRFKDWAMTLIDPMWHSAAGSIEAIHELLSAADNGMGPSSEIASSLRNLVSEVSVSS